MDQEVIETGPMREPRMPGADELAASKLHEVAEEVCGPVEEFGEVDLFGEPVQERLEKRIWTGSKRLEAYRARTALRALADPMEVAHYCMMEAFGRKDYATAHARAMELLPYFAPKLNAVAITAPGQGGAGGVLKFAWATPDEAPGRDRSEPAK
jgi:hypothetical protein